MAEPCLGDKGYTEGEKIRADAIVKATRIRQVAAVAIAIDNALQIEENYSRQRDIADRSLAMAQRQHDHAKNVFWPRELQMLEEFGVMPEREPVDQRGKRYGGRLNASIAGAFAKKLAETKCNAPRYCTSHNQKNLQDLHLVKAMVSANAAVLGQKIAWELDQADYDTAMQRRHQVIGIGRGLMGQAASLYANASENLAKVGSGLGDRLNSALNSFGNAGRQSAMSANTSELMRNAYEYSNSPARVPNPVLNLGTAPNTGLQGVSAQPGGLDLNATIGDFNSGTMTHSFQTTNPSGQISMPSNVPTTNRGMIHNADVEAVNRGQVGNKDLARSGSKTYSFTDSRGDRGEITVDMSDFPLIFYDDQQPGTT